MTEEKIDLAGGIVLAERHGGCGCGGNGSCGHGGRGHAHGGDRRLSNFGGVRVARTITEIGVRGMTCEHCAESVTEELNEIPGVFRVSVALHRGGVSIVTVKCDAPVDRAELEGAIRVAGYEPVGA